METEPRIAAEVSGWRQARAIIPLPGMVAVLVPGVILAKTGTSIGWGLGGVWAVLPVLLGVALIGAGLALWLGTVRLFARVGRGTLAPWDPTQRLVIEGPYRHLRNPMISALLGVLAGEAALFGSPALLSWLAGFFVVNQVFFVLYEEPGLERRFGDQYRSYKRIVPRWLPKRPP